MQSHGEATARSWLDKLDFRRNGPTLEIIAPSRFQADYVRQHFGEALAMHARRGDPGVTEVRITVAGSAGGATARSEPGDHERGGGK